MQFNNHVDTQLVKRFKRVMRHIYDIKFGMLQVRKNEISLQKCSGGSAQLRTLKETLITRESARFDRPGVGNLRPEWTFDITRIRIFVT